MRQDTIIAVVTICLQRRDSDVTSSQQTQQRVGVLEEQLAEKTAECSNLQGSYNYNNYIIGVCHKPKEISRLNAVTFILS